MLKKGNITSILVEFAMFPTDKGKSISEYVSRVQINNQLFPATLLKISLKY
jgi:uncharacterized protein YqgV (UPF0045/DUF77 family)